MINKTETDFLSEVFEYILGISKGECTIDDDAILNGASDNEKRILQGLSYLHEDLKFNKMELVKAMEAEYQIKSLEVKNKQLEQFNYVASHDLQEPLRTITNFSLVLKKNYGKDLDSAANQYLDFIIQSSERMRNLILGLLGFSRLGKESVLTEVNCQQLIQNVQMDLQASIAEKGAIITVDKLPNLWGYKLELRQLFQNLISNALKFRKKDNVPVIHIFCKKNKDRGEYTFCVRDNGIGIEEKHHDKIFILFQKLHHQEDYKGTGIGLANCQKIVELHQGKIWVKSTYGEGSSFFFTISDLKNK